MSKIKHLLEHAIKAWNSSERGKSRRAKLNPGATLDQIHALEKEINAHLPQSYKEFLHMTNGISGLSFNGYELMNAVEVLRHYQFQMRHINPQEDHNAKPGPGVQQKWYDKRWLPIAELGNGDFICIDFAPAPGGKKGQLVEFEHDGPHRNVKADSFSAWLEKGLSQIEGMQAEQAAEQQPAKQEPAEPAATPAPEQKPEAPAAKPQMEGLGINLPARPAYLNW